MTRSPTCDVMEHATTPTPTPAASPKASVTTARPATVATVGSRGDSIDQKSRQDDSKRLLANPWTQTDGDTDATTDDEDCLQHRPYQKRSVVVDRGVTMREKQVLRADVLLVKGQFHGEADVKSLGIDVG